MPSNEESISSLLLQEMDPYPGRFEASLRDTLGVVLALVLALILRVPGITLALALLYLMQRERPGLTFRVGLQIFAAAIVACLGSLLWTQLTDGTDVARFLGIVIGVFVSAFCMVATTLPLFWTIVGFYGFVNLAAWDAHRSTNAIVTASLYNVASIGLVVLCAVAVEYVFGTKHPAEALKQEMKLRLISLQRFYTSLVEARDSNADNHLESSHKQLIKLTHAGDVYMNELYDRLRDMSEHLSDVPLGLHFRITLLTRMLEKSVLIGFNRPHEKDAEAYRAIADICGKLAIEQADISFQSLSSTNKVLQEIYAELGRYSKIQNPPDNQQTEAIENPSTPKLPQMFLPGVFDNADAVIYALKLTLAATICYIIYNAVAWPGILTSVVTVLFTGLSSTGAMKQKQLYRFAGAFIGGLLGILTVSLLYPNMDSITSLVIVVAPVAFISGWIMRSPRMSYVGVQVAFGFFLTALPGFSATSQFAPARDRVIGVSLGILVMWFVFDQLWPVRTTDVLKNSLHRIHEATLQLQQLIQSPETRWDDHAFQRLRTTVSSELVNAQQLGFSARFEIGRHRNKEVSRTKRLLAEIEQSSAEFYSIAIPASQ